MPAMRPGEFVLQSAIFLSEAQTAAARFPDFMEELRGLISQGGIVPGAAGALQRFTGAICQPGNLQDDVFSMLRVLRAEEPALSYVEALGLLVGATAEPATLSGSQPTPALEISTAALFDLLLHHWTSLGPPAPEEEIVHFEPLPPIVSPLLLHPVSASPGERGSALSRALARSAAERGLLDTDIDLAPPDLAETEPAHWQVRPGPQKVATLEVTALPELTQPPASPPAELLPVPSLIAPPMAAVEPAAASPLNTLPVSNWSPDILVAAPPLAAVPPPPLAPQPEQTAVFAVFEAFPGVEAWPALETSAPLSPEPELVPEVVTLAGAGVPPPEPLVVRAPVSVAPAALPLAKPASLERQREPALATRRLPDELLRAPAPLVAGRRSALLQPRFIALGTVLLGLLLAYTLFRYGSGSSAPSTTPASATAAQHGRTARAVRSRDPGGVIAPLAPLKALDLSPSDRASSATAATERRSTRNANTRDGVADSIPPEHSSPATNHKLGAPAEPSAAPGGGVPPLRAVHLNAPEPRLITSTRLPGVVVGSSGVMAANLIASPAPAYPPAARDAHVEGEVIVEAVVSRDGEVISARVVSGPPLLQQAAREAVERWHYRPFLVDGHPAEIATTARIEFHLNGTASSTDSLH